ncbi:MAG TPA: hypothetical protein VKZ53_09475 [Candidatus Angelobacter sp.]|nr:hypothetical protein [Candidatus Angelobacter sp.]
MKQMRAGSIFLLAGALALSGCHRQKTVVLVPQTPMPSAAKTQVPEEQPQQPPPEAQPQPQNPGIDTQPADDSKPSPATPANKAKPKQVKHPAPAPTPTPKKPVEIAKSTPPRIVIQEGGANLPNSPQVSGGTANDDAIRALSSASTDQLLTDTQTNLTGIKRELSPEEKSIVEQIGDYVKQSRQATKDGDLVRARNLALKAHLLSDELAKQK